MNDDLELIEALKQDLEKAFPELIEKYQSSLLNYAYRITGDSQGAFDIVQDVFLRFFKKFSEMLPIAHLSALLYRMTGNLAKNYVRNRVKKKEISLNADASSSQTTGYSVPLSSEDNSDNIEELEGLIYDAIQKLPEKQGKAFILKVYENKTYDEIAEILETSRNNVMVLLHRAHSSLLSDRKLMEYLDTE